MEEGRAALEKVNKEMGLALDDWDLDYYTKLFTEVRCDTTRHHPPPSFSFPLNSAECALTIAIYVSVTRRR